MKIKAVLYDMDGTLIDSEKLQKLAWTERAALRGVTIGQEFYLGAMGRNIRRVKELLTELYPDIGDTDTLYEEKEALCYIALDVKPDFIKTSTGFGTGGATLADVRLMKSIVGDTIKVKAAGGIRDLETCLAMVDAGAERIGTSAAIKILQEFEDQH